jgi:hypothetical protein
VFEAVNKLAGRVLLGLKTRNIFEKNQLKKIKKSLKFGQIAGIF